LRHLEKACPPSGFPVKFTGENLWEGRQEKECEINLAKLRRF
jgi:hypothetical protein